MAGQQSTMADRTNERGPGWSTAQGRTSADWDEWLIVLYRHRFDDVVRAAERVIGSRSLAEEIAQDAFVRCHLALTRPDAEGCYAYVRTIALNLARTALRRRAVDNRYRAGIRPLRSHADDTSPMPRSEILEAIAELPSRQREVIAYRHLLGYSERETAEVLGISPGAAKTHASRGRRHLRNRLDAVAGS